MLKNRRIRVMFRQFIFSILLLSFFTSISHSQELNATVTASFPNLPVVNKESLVRLAADLQTYLNSTKYTGGEWRDKINCNFNIFISTASDEITYSAQIVVTSQRKIYKSFEFSPMLRVSDVNWNFTYEKKQSFYSNQQVFNPITSLLDYYALIIIGLEYDSWQKTSGTPLFTKAYDILNLAQNSAYSTGWTSSAGNFNRKDFIDDMLSEKFRVAREAYADYHYAIDMYAQKNNVPAKKDLYVQKAQEKLISFIRVLESLKSKVDVRSLYLKVLFDAKHGEIIDRLFGVKDKDIYKTLKYLDPPHAAKYDDAMRN